MWMIIAFISQVSFAAPQPYYEVNYQLYMDGQLISAPKISVQPGVEKVVDHAADIRDNVKLKISAAEDNGKIGLKFNIDYSVDGNARHIEPQFTAQPGLESTFKLGRDKAGREIILKVVAVRL